MWAARPWSPRTRQAFVTRVCESALYQGKKGTRVMRSGRVHAKPGNNTWATTDMRSSCLLPQPIPHERTLTSAATTSSNRCG